MKTLAFTFTLLSFSMASCDAKALETSLQVNENRNRRNQANFQIVGQGYCQDGSGGYYKKIRGPALDPIVLTEAYCLNYCHQNPHPSLVGVEIDRFYSFDATCNCLFSPTIPNDIELSDYDPEASGTLSLASNPDGVAIQMSDGSNNVVCYRNPNFGFEPPTSSPTASPIQSNEVNFVQIGRGYCLDESQEINLYPAIVSPELPFDTNDSFCLRYCGQVIHNDLVGVQVEKLNGSQSTRCNCLFTDGIPEDIQLSNYNPAAARVFDTDNIHINSGPISGSEGTVGVMCYAISLPPATPPPTLSPTAGNTFTKVGSGFCFNEFGQNYAGVASPPQDPQITGDNFCFSYCNQIKHPKLSGVEVDRFDPENTYCNCLFSGGFPEDVQLSDFNPSAIIANTGAFAIGPVLFSDHSFNEIVCYASSIPPATPSPTVYQTESPTPSPIPPTVSPTEEVLPTGNEFSQVGMGYCQDGSYQLYSAIVSSPLSSTNEDNYCQEWCLQGPDENLVGVEVYRLSLPHMQEIDDIYCSCLYSNGIDNVEVTDYSPNADYGIEGAGVGTVQSASGDLNSICYRRNASSSPPSPRAAIPTSSPNRNASADRVRLESTTDQQLQMFEFKVNTSNGNVALKGLASQSSTFKNDSRFAASNAIDNLNATFSHTDDNLNAYWEVALDGTYDVENITIVNRFCVDSDDNNGCLCRLSNARITLYKQDVAVASRQLGNTCGELIITEAF